MKISEIENMFIVYKKAANGLEEEQVSAELVQELIEGIYIHSKKRVEIVFRFADQIEEVAKRLDQSQIC